MSKQIPDGALIVVADGGRAILYRNHETGGEASLNEEAKLSPENLDDEGPSGSRPEEQTSKQTDEATFAKQIAQNLYKLSQSGKASDIVLIADPQTLGQIRSAMHKSLPERILFTIDKDYTNHSAEEISKFIR